MGGNVFGTTAPISKQNIKPTLAKFVDELGNIFPQKKDSFHQLLPLGSVGKKDESGDIDLGYSSKNFVNPNVDSGMDLEGWGLNTTEFNEVFEKLKSNAKTTTEPELKLRAMLKLISQKINLESMLLNSENKSSAVQSLYLEFPQFDAEGQQTNASVQIDINVGDLKWLEYAYHSPKYKKGTNLKGLHRTQLLVAMFSNKGKLFKHHLGVFDKTTRQLEASTPEQVVSLLNKLYHFNITIADTDNYNSLMKYIRDNMKSDDFNAVMKSYLGILDRTKADVPDDLHKLWIQKQKEFGLKGKYLPDESALGLYKDLSEDEASDKVSPNTFKNVIAIFPGAYNPPTKGHVNTVKSVMSSPGVDKGIVLANKDSEKIWKIYKKVLPKNIEIVVPKESNDIVALHGILSKHLKDAKKKEENFFLLVSDTEDGETKFKNIKAKYPDNTRIVTVTGDTNISDNNTSDAIKDKDFARFAEYLPEELSDNDKLSIWNMLTGENLKQKEEIDEVITEIGNDYAPKPKKGFELLKKKATDETYKGKRTNNGAPGTLKSKITKLYGGDVTKAKAEKLKKRKNATPHDKRQANWFINFHKKKVNEVGESTLTPYKWKEVDVDGYWTYVKFTTDKGTRYEVNLEVMNFTPKDSTSYVKAINVEFGAEVKDTSGINYGLSVNVIVNEGDLYKVMATVADILKHYVKKFKAQAIMYSPSKKKGEDFGSKRDNLYKAFIKKAIPGVKFQQKGDMVVAILPDAVVAEQVATKSMQDILTPYLIEITQYMYKNGLNIDPAPEIEFIDDPENAENVLGTTAYYDPNKQLVVLYTANRHPKDILRSFAHEMVHHYQNLEGRLGNIQTTDVNADEALKELEREAYETGNMMFRSWENSRKNPEAEVELTPPTSEPAVLQQEEPIQEDIQIDEWGDDYERITKYVQQMQLEVTAEQQEELIKLMGF